MLGQLEEPENLFSPEVVHSRHSLRYITLHGVSLAGPGLPVSEAGYFGALECIFDEWPDRLLINLLVIASLVVGVIKVEGGFLEVLGEIEFLPI